MSTLGKDDNFWICLEAFRNLTSVMFVVNCKVTREHKINSSTHGLILIPSRFYNVIVLRTL